MEWPYTCSYWIGWFTFFLFFVFIDQKEDTRNGVEDTLHKVKAGEYVTRPEWENVFTSMTKPSEKQPLQSTVSL